MSAPFPSGRVGGCAFRTPSCPPPVLLRATPWWADALALTVALVAVVLGAVALT